MTMLRLERAQLPVAGSALALCALAGAAAALRAPAGPLIGVAVVLVLVSLAEWRHGVTAILVVLPFSGVPVFMAGHAGLAMRDVALVLPLYVAFALWMTERHGSLLPPLGIALPALALFAIIVLGSVVRAPSLSIGALGTKIWLAYIPMLAVGYHYVRTAADWDRALRLTALLGLIPAAIAVAEWFIATRYPPAGAWSNNFGPFRYLYGSWFEQVRTTGVAMSAGSHTFVVPRVPSTFTSSTQFYLFSMVAYAAGLSQALRGPRLFWLGCASVLAMGVLATGERQAYVAMPAMTVLSLMLGGQGRARLAIIAAAAGGLVLILMALGGAPLAVLGTMPDHAGVELGHAWRELQSGLNSGPIGHGTGWDTQAALRYGGSASKRYVENWYSKAALELGVVGLAAIVMALASLHWRLITALIRIDPVTRRAAAPICVLLLVMTATLFKGPVLDLDPMNVYFWLLTGMLLSFMRPGFAVVAVRADDAPVRAEAAP
jgi:hypothetical protein